MNLAVRTLFSLIVVILFSSTASASGYGWYVKSFDWKAYEASEVKIRGAYLQIARSQVPQVNSADARPRMREMPAEMATRMAFYGCCTADSNGPAIHVPPSIKASEESLPGEFLWSNALRYAAKLESRSGAVPNYFDFFGFGRSYVDGRALKQCTYGDDVWGYCSGATFILSPDEIAAFDDRVVRLNASVRHPRSFGPYLIDLEKVLHKYRDGRHGLLFEGHD